MVQRSYISRICAKIASTDPDRPRLAQAAQSALLSSGIRREWERLAVPERLASPDRIGEFRLAWHTDGGSVRVARGFFAAYTRLPGHSAAVFRPGLTEDEIACRAFWLMLTGALAGTGAGIVCGADIDVSCMSDAESMRFCRSFADGVREFAEPRASLWAELPARERAYLSGMYGIAARVDPPGASATGFGACCCADELLRRRNGVGLCGRCAVVTGRGPEALAAAEAAKRMGATLVSENADVWILCDGERPLDAGRAAALSAQAPDGVVEGVCMACEPEAADLLENAGVPLIPSAAAGAGAAIRSRLPAELSDWEAEGFLRRAVSDILRAADGAEKWREGVYSAAVGRAADALIRQGL